MASIAACPHTKHRDELVQERFERSNLLDTFFGAPNARAAAALIRQYADRLASLVDPVPVLMADERMSTAAAARRLSERGVRGRRQRAVVDQAAAVEILQHWLDTQHAQSDDPA